MVHGVSEVGALVSHVASEAGVCGSRGKQGSMCHDGAKCADCNGLFHPACSGQSLDAIRKLRSGSRKWRCVACRGEAASASSRSDVDTNEPSTVMDMLKVMRKDMAKNMDESRKRFDGIDESFNEVKVTLEEFRGKIKVLEEEKELLNERCEEHERNLGAANKTITLLQREVHDLQQYSRRSNIEVKGIPRTPREDVYTILELVAKALNVPYHRADISTAHRLPVRNQHDLPIIIVAFVSRSTREMWLSAARTRRVSTTDVSTHLDHGPVFINPHLTGHNKALLGRAKKMVREGKLHSAWSMDGKVLIKRKEKDPASRINLMDDLDRLDKPT